MMGETTLGIEDLLRPMKLARGGAVAWLAQLLGDGPMPEAWIEKQAEAAHYSMRTVRRAKDDLGVASDHVGFGKEGRWEWSLPRA